MAQPLRYTFILALVAVSMALAAVGGWRYARASAPVSGPIILISVDALRADHLPAYGYRGVRTPAIDALAADGVVFERAYSHSPQTLPAHASLLSGRLPFETGVRDNAGFVVKDAERLLAEMLSDRGYATGGVVSSYVLRRETGIGQGFAFFDSDMPASETGSRRLERRGEESVALAEEWLEGAGTERAFLFLHLHEPHAPHAAPDRFDAYEPYDGEIASVDESVGRLVRFLKAHQLYDQSTIVLVSDHGEGLGDHGEIGHGLLVYDEALRVPLIIKRAAGESAGRRVTDLVQHADLVPTILDLAKAPVPFDLPGRSLVGLLDGTKHFGARTAYSESMLGRYRFGWAGLATLTDGRFRYVRAPREELYDLDGDSRDVITTAVAEARSLRAALEQLAPASAPLHAPQPVSPDERRHLRALGHVGDVDAEVPGNGPEDGARADPKEMVGVLETYRAAVLHAESGRPADAVSMLQEILQHEPDLADVWRELGDTAARAQRHDLALEAYRQLVAREPGRAAGLMGEALTLVRLRRFADAQQEAQRAAFAATETDADARALPAYVAGRWLADQRRHEEALAAFSSALDTLARPAGRRLDDLHFYTAEVLARLDRQAEAEYHYLEELSAAPSHIRARAGLAALYSRTGRTGEAEEVIAELVRTASTPEGFAAAARLWTLLGNMRAAAEARAHARRPAQSQPARSEQ